MKVVVVGTGYVGLVTGTCLAEVGHEVTCVDIDQIKVESLRRGEIPIYEPGLSELVNKNVAEDRLAFTTSLPEAMQRAEVVFFALPTPSREDGSADLSHVMRVTKRLGELLQRYTVVVNKSTVPVGTTARIRKLLYTTAKAEFDVVSNPEFLREGLAVQDFMQPDRIVVGSSSKQANEVMANLYADFSRKGSPILYMDEASAEMTKYAANAFLAVKISFMNEMANLSDRVGANVDAIRAGIGSDKRIGKHFLQAGIGFGGSCFPKDVKALRKTAHKYGYDFPILDAVQTVNERQRKVLINKLNEYFGGDINGKRLAVWGLAFKPDTDDIREAQSLYILQELLDAGAEVVAFDPVAMPNVTKKLGTDVIMADSAMEAAAEADALLLLTEWEEFRNADLRELANTMKHKVLFDGRNVFDLKVMRKLGFHYASIGRPMVEQEAVAHGE